MSPVGVRYQVASANRSAARVLDPGGLRARQRMAADEARRRRSRPTTARLTEPTSVTTQSSPATASTSATIAASDCTGAATKTKSAPSTASATLSWASSTAPRAIAVSRAAVDGS